MVIDLCGVVNVDGFDFDASFSVNGRECTVAVEHYWGKMLNTRVTLSIIGVLRPIRKSNN